MAELFIGLMSGTSLDGVDGVLASIGLAGRTFGVVAHCHQPFPRALAAELLALNAAGEQELHRAALAANAVARAYADVTAAVLAAGGVPASAIRALGAHGQTVRHRPGAFDGTGYTLQLLNAALLAELTGIDVAADFRSRDLAAGGQGAPLVPAFHRRVFGREGATVAVLNLGGMSNLTVLEPDGTTLGFDCGPGNVLMDHWIARARGDAFDAGGAWAATGTVIEPLLRDMLADPFFALPPPKSTGRDQFHPQWLADALARTSRAAAAPARDVQATLAELTARIVTDAVRRHAPGAVELVVCGGGARSAYLMARIGAMLQPVATVASDDRGLPATQVEASAFAWLAAALTERRTGNLPAVTGARGYRILGALYPGG